MFSSFFLRKLLRIRDQQIAKIVPIEALLFLTEDGSTVGRPIVCQLNIILLFKEMFDRDIDNVGKSYSFCNSSFPLWEGYHFDQAANPM